MAPHEDSPALRGADPDGGITLAEMADWIAARRADGHPADAPLTVRTHTNATLGRSTIFRAGVVVGPALEKVRADRVDAEGRLGS